MKRILAFISKYYACSNRILSVCLLISSLLLGSFFSPPATAFVWEITDSKLPYIAKIRADPQWGSAVIYNPVMCKEIGAACGFFRTHAFAHAHRNHILLPPEAYPATLEAEADCWAAKNGKPDEVYAAVQLLLDENRNPDLNITGNPLERAEKVRACAEQAGNWPHD